MLLGQVVWIATCSAATTQYRLSKNTVLINSMTASEVLDQYQTHSNQVKQIKEKYSLKSLEAKVKEETASQTKKSISELDGALGTYYKLRSELKTVINNLQTEYDNYLLSEHCEVSVKIQYEMALKEYQSQFDAVCQQISSLNDTYSSINDQYYGYLLESNLNHFYIINRELCEKEETNQLLYEFYSNILSLVLLKEQQKYYDCYEEHLRTQEKVEKTKLKNGMSTMLNLSNVQNALLKSCTEKNELELSYDSGFSLIYDEIGQENIDIVVELDTAKKTYDSTKIIETILKENTTYQKLQDMILVYRDYMVSGAYITLGEQQQINELISSYETQKVLLEKSVERYVESILKSYDQSVLVVNANVNHRKSLEQQCQMVKEQKEHGRATLLDVESAALQLSENEVNYYNALVKKMKYEYILDHCLYGIKVE